MESAEIVLDALRDQYVAYLHGALLNLAIIQQPPNSHSFINKTPFLKVSILVLMVHDCLILLDLEIEHVWQTKWNVGKVLYILSRYGPFLDTPIMVILEVVPYEEMSYGTCATLHKIATWYRVIGVLTSESILLLRTNAIYSGSKRATTFLSAIYVASSVGGVIVTWRYLQSSAFSPPPSDIFNACALFRGDEIVFFDFLILLVFELFVLILTVGSGFREIRSRGSLLRVVYRDSISFFLVLFGQTLSAILILQMAPPQYGELMGSSTRVTHSIICCRILLNLRQAATPNDTSTEVSTGLVFASSTGQQTNQPEATRLEGD